MPNSKYARYVKKWSAKNRHAPQNGSQGLLDPFPYPDTPLPKTRAFQRFRLPPGTSFSRQSLTNPLHFPLDYLQVLTYHLRRDLAGAGGGTPRPGFTYRNGKTHRLGCGCPACFFRGGHHRKLEKG